MTIGAGLTLSLAYAPTRESMKWSWQVAVASGRSMNVERRVFATWYIRLGQCPMRWGEFDELADGGLNVGRTNELLRSEIGIVDLM